MNRKFLILTILLSIAISEKALSQSKTWIAGGIGASFVGDMKDFNNKMKSINSDYKKASPASISFQLQSGYNFTDNIAVFLEIMLEYGTSKENDQYLGLDISAASLNCSYSILKKEHFDFALRAGIGLYETNLTYSNDATKPLSLALEQKYNLNLPLGFSFWFHPVKGKTSALGLTALYRVPLSYSDVYVLGRNDKANEFGKVGENKVYIGFGVKLGL